MLPIVFLGITLSLLTRDKVQKPSLIRLKIDLLKMMTKNKVKPHQFQISHCIVYMRILPWKISLLDGVSSKFNQNNRNSVWFWMQMVKEFKIRYLNFSEWNHRSWNFALKFGRNPEKEVLWICSFGYEWNIFILPFLDTLGPRVYPF